MHRASLPSVALALGCISSVGLGSGCSRSCGTFQYQTGLVVVDGDETIDIDAHELYEVCGANSGGSFGSEDFADEGLSWLWFSGMHRRLDIALATSIVNEVFFPTEELRVGATPQIIEANAYYLDVGGVVRSAATFTEGTIEVVDVREEVDEIWGTRDWRIRWSVTWGEPGVSEFWYVTEGEDWLPMQDARPEI